ncbi:MAG: peptidylprolyl isomerase [bacterium]|nr:peptidylprolyl isomerase [bacterium]MCP5066935.1 peptidylprolyl isomerase [bacterium]
MLEIADHGEIRIELLPELAPKSVESFISLAEADLYDGTLFHRVIPGFMIQGGDPNSKDDDPANDGMGGPGYTVPDEFSQVSFVRGIVALARTAQPDSAGSQFFIVHEDSRQLDSQYTVIGRVTGGIDVVDTICRVPIDRVGADGPKDRPRNSVVLLDVRIEKTGSASASPDEASEPAEPSKNAREWDEGST